MSEIILACHDEELRSELRERIHSSPAAADLVVKPCTNAGDARAAQNVDTKLVVTTLQLPNDFKTPVHPQELLGLDFLQWLHRAALEIPAVLIASRTTDIDMVRNDAITTTFKTYVVEEGPRLFDKFLSSLDAAIRGIPVTRKYMKVQIMLNESPRKSRYHCIGVGFREHFDTGEQELRLDDTQLRMLKLWARDVGAGNSWQTSLSNYSNELGVMLFKNNPHFENHVNDAMQREALQPSDTKLTFTIDRGLHQMILESVKAPGNLSEENEPERGGADSQLLSYWALKAPLYRKMRTKSLHRPLFRGEGTRNNRPINCLIINANLRDWHTFDDIQVDERTSLSLGPLDYADSECDEVEQILREHKEEYRLNRIQVLSSSIESPDFSQTVMQTLEEADEPWHFVHFCGHSHFDSVNKRGYVFLQDATPVAVDVARFSEALRHVRFVFLNSCQSAEPEFVYELVRHRVPAVSGFRWAVNDQHAAEYAKAFYRQLFERRSLEHAFKEARVHVSTNFPEDPLWASSVLVMQA